MHKKWCGKHKNRWKKAFALALGIGLACSSAVPAYSADTRSDSAVEADIQNAQGDEAEQISLPESGNADVSEKTEITDSAQNAEQPADTAGEGNAAITSEPAGGEETAPDTAAVPQTESAEASGSKAAPEAENAEAAGAEDAKTSAGMGRPVIRRIIRKDSFTQTYIFRDEDGTEISRQILSDDEALIRPSIPETKDGYAFAGWFREDGTEFADSEFGRTAQQLNGDEPLSEQTTESPVLLTARYRTSYIVQYLSSSDPDASVAFTQDYADGDTISYADLRKVVESRDDTQELIGWSKDPAAKSPDQTFVIHEDTRLYPVFDGAHWIDFETNGGTPVQSVYVEYQQPTSEPAASTKPGYTLDGWYTDPECTAKFTFGGTISQDTILYAKWEPVNTSHYRIIYWVQSGTDRYDTPENEKTYMYWGSRNVSDVITDSVAKVSEENKNYPVDSNHKQLILNQSKSETEKKVLADGSTEMNLYFDRQVITLNFYNTKDEIDNDGKPQITMKGLYGQTPDFYHYTFPELGEKQYWVDTIRGWEWHPDNVYFYDPSYSGKSVDNFYIFNGEYFYKYYNFYENLDGTWPEKPDPENGTIAYSPGHTWVPSKESGSAYYLEQIRVDTKDGESWQEGPWKNVYTDDGSVDTDVVNKNGDDVGVVGNGKLVYHRMKRSVHKFILRNAATKYSEASDILSYSDIRYGTPLKDLGKYYDDVNMDQLLADIKNPPRPENLPDYYVFDGWYTTSTFKTPFDFETAVMGNSNKIAYARWVAPDVSVRVKLNNGSSDEIETTHAGEHVAEPPIPERKNFAFIGWIDRYGHPFDFETPITQDTTVFAAWVSTVRTYTVSYDLNGGSGVVPVDQNRYYEGARAKAAASNELKPPAGKKGFIAWQDDDGAYYFPGDTVQMPEKDLVLKAVWADDRVTKLTYDYGYDAREGGRTESEVITQPNADYTVTKEPEREGYRFLRWETRAGLAVYPGDAIHIDTLDPENNVLLAIWEKTDNPAKSEPESVPDPVKPETPESVSESSETGNPAASQPEAPAAGPASAETKDGKSSAVATGDTAQSALAVTMILLSAACIGVWFAAARKKKN